MTRTCLITRTIAVATLTWAVTLAACAKTGGNTDGAEDGGLTPECTENAHCNDNNACTEDVCSPAGICERNPNTAPCDDNNACTQGDTCANGVCEGGDNTCTCIGTPDCAPFEDSDKCNGTLVCGPDNVCVPDPSTVVSCLTTNDTDCTKRMSAGHRRMSDDQRESRHRM